MASLYIIATPIGNLDDITLRAAATLRMVDVVACEDTRRTLKLLSALDIKKPLMSCRAENEGAAAKRICELLAGGKEVAYASDAGTPALSDPGSLLVREVRSAGFAVCPIPGVSAFATIVSVAGVRDKTVTFEGFLSPKPGKRRRRLQELLEREEAFVLYESPFRILKLLGDLSDLSPDRAIVIGREMTKVYEEYRIDTAQGHIAELQQRNKVVGEFTVLVSGNKMA
ncbi:MAG TPA: 16S rRNA (cytidine(1402)-2'-O)-methyltransferase, partial [Spirochaetia bacterium]|nr:16S rRNA (cytidine(1402)-2'-O)-methyltransferase [Spirochaetia bacterium]